MQAIMKTKPEKGFEIKEIPEPEINHGSEVKIKVDVASICGTDHHMWIYDQWAQKRLPPAIPFVAGHEMGGTIVDIGDDVKNLQIGDKVSMECHEADLTCYQCRSNRMHICRNTKIFGVDKDGIFAKYAVIPELNAWKNDQDLDPALTSLQDPLGNAVHTILPMNLSADEGIAGKNILITGCGPIGLMSIPVVKMLGAGQVFATAGGNNMLRLNMAKEMGADLVLNAREEGDKIPKIIRDTTDGNGVDILLEMAGNVHALKQGLNALTYGGRVSLLGFFSGPITFDINSLMISKGASIYGIAGRRMFQTWQVMRGLLKNKSLQDKLRKLITHRVNMAEWEKGMIEIDEKRAIKVIMDPFN
ncbi:MAG: zinc-binding dehydrogenase [Candidatus Hodarchaeales archaeon]|jgi:threonine 3-dehydrogenase